LFPRLGLHAGPDSQCVPSYTYTSCPCRVCPHLLVDNRCPSCWSYSADHQSRSLSYQVPKGHIRTGRPAQQRGRLQVDYLIRTTMKRLSNACMRAGLLRWPKTYPMYAKARPIPPWQATLYLPRLLPKPGCSPDRLSAIVMTRTDRQAEMLRNKFRFLCSSEGRLSTTEADYFKKAHWLPIALPDSVYERVWEAIAFVAHLCRCCFLSMMARRFAVLGSTGRSWRGKKEVQTPLRKHYCRAEAHHSSIAQREHETCVT
jgi:hypothetical protein